MAAGGEATAKWDVVGGRGAALTFWGTRAGIAAPGAATLAFGGNSPCAAIEFPGEEATGRAGPAPRHVVIFDAGTGLRPLGAHLARRTPVACDLLFAATGFDRICGLPFFAVAFDAANRIACHAAHRPEEGDIRTALTRLMADPLFPVPIDIFKAAASFHDLAEGGAVALAAGATASALPLAGGRAGAPQAAAWRLEADGAALVYACALDPHRDGVRLAAFARGCDLLVLGTVAGAADAGDADIAAIAERAEAAAIVVTDHAPEAADEQLRCRERALQRRLPRARFAREGMTVPLAQR